MHVAYGRERGKTERRATVDIKSRAQHNNGWTKVARSSLLLT
jgi:hypothetical protein